MRRHCTVSGTSKSGCCLTSESLIERGTEARQQRAWRREGPCPTVFATTRAAGSRSRRRTIIICASTGTCFAAKLTLRLGSPHKAIRVSRTLGYENTRGKRKVMRVVETRTARTGAPNSARFLSHCYVPSCQLERYFFCSGESVSISMPIEASFNDATVSSMSSGTLCTPGVKASP